MTVTQLYQRLVETGFLPRGTNDADNKQKEEEEDGAGYSIIPVDFSQPETLKM
jgi:hypothetical protein